MDAVMAIGVVAECGSAHHQTRRLPRIARGSGGSKRTCSSRTSSLSVATRGRSPLTDQVRAGAQLIAPCRDCEIRCSPTNPVPWARGLLSEFYTSIRTGSAKPDLATVDHRHGVSGIQSQRRSIVKLFITGAGGFSVEPSWTPLLLQGHEVFGLAFTALHAGWLYVGTGRPQVASTLGSNARQRRRRDPPCSSQERRPGRSASARWYLQKSCSKMRQHGTTRLVHVSSFVVYDYDAVARRGNAGRDHLPNRILTGATNTLRPRLHKRLSSASSLQSSATSPSSVLAPCGERTICGTAAKQCRPVRSGSRSPTAELKLTYVVNCAEAIVAAVDGVPWARCSISPMMSGPPQWNLRGCCARPERRSRQRLVPFPLLRSSLSSCTGE